MVGEERCPVDTTLVEASSVRKNLRRQAENFRVKRPGGERGKYLGKRPLAGKVEQQGKETRTAAAKVRKKLNQNPFVDVGGEGKTRREGKNDALRQQPRGGRVRAAGGRFMGGPSGERRRS